jgi:hypothetical protein
MKAKIKTLLDRPAPPCPCFAELQRHPARAADRCAAPVSTRRPYLHSLRCEPSLLTVRVFLPSSPTRTTTQRVGSWHRLRPLTILWMQAFPTPNFSAIFDNDMPVSRSSNARSTSASVSLALGCPWPMRLFWQLRATVIFTMSTSFTELCGACSGRRPRSWIRGRW